MVRGWAGWEERGTQPVAEGSPGGLLEPIASSLPCKHSVHAKNALSPALFRGSKERAIGRAATQTVLIWWGVFVTGENAG